MKEREDFVSISKKGVAFYFNPVLFSLFKSKIYYFFCLFACIEDLLFPFSIFFSFTLSFNYFLSFFIFTPFKIKQK
jgi:hypothetical protein